MIKTRPSAFASLGVAFLMCLMTWLAPARAADVPAAAKLVSTNKTVSFELGTEANASLPVNVNAGGIVRIGELMLVGDYREDKTSTTQNASGVILPTPDFPKAAPGNLWTLQATFSPKTGTSPLHLEESIQRLSADRVGFSLGLSDPQKKTPVQKLRWTVHLPVEAYANRTVTVGTKSIVLPQKLDGFPIAGASGTSIDIPVDRGILRLTGSLKVLVADGRAFAQGDYLLIIEEDPASAEPFERTLKCEMSFVPYKFEPIDFRSSANMEFRDETYGDGKGGWTDQGADQDLRYFPTGKQEFANVPFSILTPEENNAKTCLVFAGPQRPSMLKEASLPLEDRHYKTLFLLHAFAWDQKPGTVIGTLHVEYKDGTSEDLSVQAHREAGNWGAPYDTPNGVVAWQGKTNKGGDAGLNLSKFSLTDKPLKQIVIQGSGQAVWMIAGITGSLNEVPLDLPRANRPLKLEASKDWTPYAFAYDVEKGSLLDFSQFVDAPAGKYGRVIVKDGHFVFENEPNKSVRFLGTNLVFAANFVDHAMAERLATRLARMGYNAVRFHHYDLGLLKANATSSHDFDPEKLDRLDYFVACCKNAGLYVTIDLYTHRIFKPGEIEEISTPVSMGIKVAAALSPSAQKAWETFALQLLSHKNPYTGYTYAEEPAMYGICPFNENVHKVFWNNDPAVAKLVKTRYSEWLQKQGLPETGFSEEAPSFIRFLTETQLDHQKRTADFLRNEAGVRSLLTDINHRDYKNLTLTRDHLDFVDMHRYWDHPTFVAAEWKLPFRYNGGSAIEASAATPREMFPTRMPGKPFTVAEYHFVYPNPFRAESGPLMGAYAALQNWDGLFRFDYGGGIPKAMVDGTVEPSFMGAFDTYNDPISILADRLIDLLFLRGDVKASSNRILYSINAEELLKANGASGSFSPAFSELGLITGVGSVLEGGSTPISGKPPLATIVETQGPADAAKKVFADQADLFGTLSAAGILDPKLHQEGRFLSDTHEIALDSKRKTFSVITPRTEAFMQVDPGQIEGPVSHIKTSGAAMVSVSAMDGNPLATSKRLLILHLTDVQNTDITFHTSARKVLDAWGKAPQLVAQGKAEVRLEFQRPTPRFVLWGFEFPPHKSPHYVLWALDMSGKRLWKVPVAQTKGSVSFELTTTSKQGISFAYELVAEGE